jgi:hypothetical protein
MNSVLTILEAIYRLTPGCHGGNPSPSDTYDTYLQIFYLVEPFILDICFITNHCTQYFCSYMFRLCAVAIIREPHHTDMNGNMYINVLLNRYIIPVKLRLKLHVWY